MPFTTPFQGQIPGFKGSLEPMSVYIIYSAEPEWRSSSWKTQIATVIRSQSSSGTSNQATGLKSIEEIGALHEKNLQTIVKLNKESSTRRISRSSVSGLSNPKKKLTVQGPGLNREPPVSFWLQSRAPNADVVLDVVNNIQDIKDSLKHHITPGKVIKKSHTSYLNELIAQSTADERHKIAPTKTAATSSRLSSFMLVDAALFFCAARALFMISNTP
ncbi:hypothetical protein DFH11DRAFT_1541882 [Phellopilus nigrolimitatus]|nr:hypothetical protein DFH11DRAFT_1541882 [Phellopilus nigrolimitatus]